MPVDPQFATLARHIGEFHITDRTMKAAQDQIAAAIAGGDVDDGAREKYLRAARHYFDGFAREARGHIRDVDRRLEHANQVVFNLTAERAVAVKRIEATESVLRDVSALSGVPAP